MRERFAARLADAGLPSLPSAGNFILVDLGVDDTELAERLVQRGVLIRPGSEMGLPGYARITIGPEAMMERAADELLAVRATMTDTAVAS